MFGVGGVRPQGKAEESMSASTWLPEGWKHPRRVELPTGHHLRPIGPDDTELDMPAVMGSQVRLWSIYGGIWGWPPPTMTAEQDREDLQHHVDEMERNEGFNFALFDADETELIGCVYIDPPEKVGSDADISWWVREEYLGSEVERAFDETVPGWIDAEWPLEAPYFIGHSISWDDWLALPMA